MEPTEIKRLYANSDAEMTESARVTQSLLVADLAKFTSFDSTINAAFASTFLTAITAASTVVADTAVADMQVQKSELVEPLMDKAKNKYADVKYFVEKSFPTSPATQNEFGLNDYMRARRNATQMIQFLDEMSKASIKYQTQLVAKGFNATAIAEIQTIKTDLQVANTDKQVFKKQRPKLTEDRVKVLNKCYEFIVQINAAAQRVYKDDFAKQKQFVYTISPQDTIQEFKGEVTSNSIVTVASIGYDPEIIYKFSNTGLVPLVFCLSKTTTLEGIEIAIGGGATVTKLGSELNPDGTNLLVKNTSTTATGSYEIVLEN